MRDLEVTEVEEVSGADCHGNCEVSVTCIYQFCVPVVQCSVWCSF